MQQSYVLIPETALRNIQSELAEIKTILLEKKGSSTPALKDWITQKEAMVLLGKKYTSLYKLRRDGQIIATSTRPIFYSLTSINKYLDSMR